MSQQWMPPPSPTDAPASVPNYLVPAIISVFCCSPLGIVAIIFAAQVNGKVASGDIAGALDSSKKAKLFSFISIGLGLAVIVFYVIFIVILGGIGAMSGGRF
jgi:Interferon-induced transmembrane protein